MPELRDARLSRRFYSSTSEKLARALLGKKLVRVLPGGERLVGVIVETEAYVGVIDRASHAFGGRRTPRNESMYGQAGTAYVYFTYGMHHCVNVVCGSEGEPVAVLLRALEPIEGLETMRRLRSVGKPAARTLAEGDLCSGPGKLCQALGIDRALDRTDLVTGSDLFIERGTGETPRSIACCPRIGIDSAGEWAGKHLRWLIDSNPHVSVPAPSRRSGARSQTSRAKTS